VLIMINPLLAKSQEREQLTIPLSDPMKEGKLEVGLVTGSIKIIGYAGKGVVIDAVAVDKNDGNDRRDDRNRLNNLSTKTNHTINGKGKSSMDVTGMKKISTSDGFELTAKEKNNTIQVGVDKVNMTINLTIKVPQKTSLKVSTINDGDISVENVHGNLEISNINGSIKMKNIGGSVIANTINEDIIVNFTEVTPNTPMAFTTLNGNVDITFPQTLKANVKLKTDEGDILSDFDIDIDKTASKINYSSDKEKGLYKIKKEDWTLGKINGGGAEIMMKTMNGDVIIRKVK
jgi:Putative adhesin